MTEVTTIIQEVPTLILSSVGVQGPQGYPGPALVENVQVADYQFALSDVNVIVVGNKATAITFTVPTNATVAFPVGTVIPLFQLGQGQLVIAPANGVTIDSPGGRLKLATQFSSAALRKRATDEWVLTGDITT